MAKNGAVDEGQVGGAEEVEAAGGAAGTRAVEIVRNLGIYGTVHGSKVDRYTRWRKRRSGTNINRSLSRTLIG